MELYGICTPIYPEEPRHIPLILPPEINVVVIVVKEIVITGSIHGQKAGSMI
jgi:hypothetical protein